MSDTGIPHLRRNITNEVYMAARQDGQADHMRLFLYSLFDDFFRRETDTVIAHIHANLARLGGNLFGAVGVTIQARLAEHICDRPSKHFRYPLDFGLDFSLFRFRVSR